MVRFLRTARQVISNIWPVLFKLAPTYRFLDVSSIDTRFLEMGGIELVIWDVDGTLMSYHDTVLPPSFDRQLESLAGTGPTHHAILSNCDEVRFIALGSVFPDVPVFRGYELDGQWITRIRRGDQDTHSRSEIADLLERGARHIRKPDARLVPSIMKALNVTDANRTLVVGDQYMTDVATAHLAGARSAKVATWDRRSFPRSIRMTQRLEGFLSPLITLGRRPQRLKE